MASSKETGSYHKMQNKEFLPDTPLPSIEKTPPLTEKAESAKLLSGVVYDARREISSKFKNTNKKPAISKAWKNWRKLEEQREKREKEEQDKKAQRSRALEELVRRRAQKRNKQQEKNK